MSRSYKKNMLHTIGDKSWKKIYARKYRRKHKYDTDIISSLGGYKKEDNSWNIVDLVCGFNDFEEYRKYCEEYGDDISHWYKWRSK